MLLWMDRSQSFIVALTDLFNSLFATIHYYALCIVSPNDLLMVILITEEICQGFCVALPFSFHG